MPDDFIYRLKWKAQDNPEATLYTWLNDHGKIEHTQTLSYAEFLNATHFLAQYLLDELECKPGDRVMLVFLPGNAFIVAFVACLRANVVAVPVYPPRPNSRKDVELFVNVQKSCEAKIALTDSKYGWAKRVSGIKKSLVKWISTSSNEEVIFPEDLQWKVVDPLNLSFRLTGEETPDDPRLDAHLPTDTAFLQYTSGSTSSPKGVVLSFHNLACNLHAIESALDAFEDTVVVSWLPQYHDMGLIGSCLGTAYVGGRAYLMSPAAFVMSPSTYWKCVSKFQATHIQLPQFAYGLSVRKCAGKFSNDVNFSSVRHVFNAAEPLDYCAINEFQREFAKNGLDFDAMRPGYGLAEHTVYVCDSGHLKLRVDRSKLENDGVVCEDPESDYVMVGCGDPQRLLFDDYDIDLRIVDPDSRVELSDDKVGEIWINSSSKADAYYNMPELSRTHLHAELASSLCVEKLDGGFLRTGDLGFIHNQELFVCGRIKDLIIIRGRNHYPQDIEKSIERDSDNLKPGCSAAFTCGNPETLVAICEVRNKVKKSQFASIAFEISSRVLKEHGVKCGDVVLVKERTIPKTTSGKISRSKCKQAYLNNALMAVHWVAVQRPQQQQPLRDEIDSDEDAMAIEDVAPAAAEFDPQVLDKLVSEAANLLESGGEIDPNSPLEAQGFDSMARSQLRGIVYNEFQVEISEEELFADGFTLKRAAQLVANPNAVGEASAGVGPPPPRRRRKSWFDCFPCCRANVKRAAEEE